MLILISSENKINHEGAICNELFQSGLPLLHLRKPEVEEDYFRDLLNSINAEYHARISLHQFHNLEIDFKIGGLHFTEKNRISFGENLNSHLEMKQKEGMRITTSIHSLSNFPKSNFDYYFLSPLFDSISKKDYKGHRINVDEREEKIIGLGGIKESNIKKAQELGYSGVAVLGSIWNGRNPLQSYHKIKGEYLKSYPSKINIHA